MEQGKLKNSLIMDFSCSLTTFASIDNQLTRVFIARGTVDIHVCFTVEAEAHIWLFTAELVRVSVLLDCITLISCKMKVRFYFTEGKEVGPYFPAF